GTNRRIPCRRRSAGLQRRHRPEGRSPLIRTADSTRRGSSRAHSGLSASSTLQQCPKLRPESLCHLYDQRAFLMRFVLEPPPSTLCPNIEKGTPSGMPWCTVHSLADWSHANSDSQP